MTSKSIDNKMKKNSTLNDKNKKMGEYYDGIWLLKLEHTNSIHSCKFIIRPGDRKKN